MERERREEKGRGRDGRPGGRAPQNFWARTATACRAYIPYLHRASEAE
jgi:hypothetical protein